MGKNRRVVVTGMGAITPIGNSVEEFWNGIKEGKTGFGPITYFDTADYRCKLAADRACGFVFYFPLLSFAFPVPSAVQ